MKVNYIVVCYLGPRRAHQVSADPIEMIKYHLNFLNDNKIEGVARVSVVVNADSKGDIEKMQELIRSYEDYYTELKLFYRRNLGHSYGGWNDTIQNCIVKDEKFDYFFLTEDDYGPARIDFLNYFVNKMTGSVGFVCQKLFEGGSAEYTHHAAISNGLLLYDAAKDAVDNFGSPMLIKPSWDYGMAEWNQRNFTNNFTRSGYELEDISRECSVTFMNYNPSIFPDIGFRLVEHGNPGGAAPFGPILDMKYAMVQLEEHLGEE